MKNITGLLLLGTIGAVLIAFGFSGMTTGSISSGITSAFVNGTNGRLVLVDDFGITIGPGGVEVEKRHGDKDLDRDRDRHRDRDWDHDRDWDRDRDRDWDYDRDREQEP